MDQETASYRGFSQSRLVRCGGGNGLVVLLTVMTVGFHLAPVEAANDEAAGWRRWVPPVVAELVDEAAEKIQEVTGAVPAAVESEDFPAYGAGPRTKVVPGEFVFLALPFRGQERGGICAGASLLNIIDFHGSRYDLTQEEFFKLFDAGRSGAHIGQMEQGAKNVGFSMTTLLYGERPDREQARELENKVRDLLDAGQPLSVSKTGHAFTVIGYNAEARCFYAWDQAKRVSDPRIAERVPEAPGGVYRIPMGRLGYVLRQISFLTPHETPFDQPHEKQRLLETLGAGEDLPLEKHRIWAEERQGKHDVERFFRTVAPVLIDGMLRKNRMVIVPTANPIEGKPHHTRGELVAIMERAEAGYRGTLHPAATEVEVSEREIAAFIRRNEGVYFSYPVAKPAGQGQGRAEARARPGR